MLSPDKKDCEPSGEKVFAFFLRRWRAQLLIDEAEGDPDQIELDRRVLDHYLDQYNLALSFRKRRVNSTAERTGAGLS